MIEPDNLTLARRLAKKFHPDKRCFFLIQGSDASAMITAYPLELLQKRARGE